MNNKQAHLQKNGDGGRGAGVCAVLSMGGCFALGNFTDNFYKQCAVLLAASAGLTSMQSYATVLFSLPFILFSAWAGWLADKVPKKHIVVGAKAVECVALLLGAWALLHGLWAGMLAVLFFMGLQATFFSPALNGAIPELFEAPAVPRVNSLIKLASTVAVLAGIAGAGFFLDFRYVLAPEQAAGLHVVHMPDAVLAWMPALQGAGGQLAFGRGMAGLFIILVAVVGVLVAFTMRQPPRQQHTQQHPFPWAGPVDSFRHFWALRGDSALFLVLCAEAFFYGIAAIAVISVSNLSAALGYSDTFSSMLSSALMVGIAVGALFAGRTPAESWQRLLAPASLGMGLCLWAVAATPLAPTLLPWVPMAQAGWFFVWLFLCGVCGGVYLIPLASFIQVRPAPSEKGRVIGVSNFLSFVFIACCGVLFYVVAAGLGAVAAALFAQETARVAASAGVFLVYGGVLAGLATVVWRRVHAKGWSL